MRPCDLLQAATNGMHNHMDNNNDTNNIDLSSNYQKALSIDTNLKRNGFKEQLPSQELVKDACHKDTQNGYKIIQNKAVNDNSKMNTRTCISEKQQIADGTSTASREITTATKRSMSTRAIVKKIWRSSDCVCFDVDSTVCIDEGIDELARFCGKTEEVAKITLRAMEGELSFQDALKARLNIIHPTLQQVTAFIKTQPPRLTPGVKQLVRLLHERDTPVYLISGGFRSIIGPIAEELNIPVANVFANRLKFYYDGEYAGFEDGEPTAHSGGKGEVIRMLKEQHGYNRLVMVGDGMTDLETCPPADAFIGFGGNQVRGQVKQQSLWYVTSCKELIDGLRSQSDEDEE